jgi:type IV pilus assembly protein PilW
MNRRTLPYDHVPLRGHAGFTLIELMVAMVLGLLIIVGVLSVFLANKQTYGRSEDLSLYQEKARFVSDLLTQDIRQADGTPCRKRDTSYPINQVDTDLDWGEEEEGIEGYSGDPNSEIPDEVDFGTGVADRVAGTDALRVTGTLGVVFSVLSCTHPTFTLNYPPGVTAHGFDDSSNLIVCYFDTEYATLFVKAGSSASTVSYDSDNASLCEKYLQNSLISEASQVLWYLGCNGLPDKPCNTPAGRSLYRNYRNTARPVIDGVADLQIEYLSRDGTAYEELANAWGDVVAVRLTLDLEPPQPGAGENTPPTPRLLQVIALRNRIPL